MVGSTPRTSTSEAGGAAWGGGAVVGTATVVAAIVDVVVEAVVAVVVATLDPVAVPTLSATAGADDGGRDVVAGGDGGDEQPGDHDAEHRHRSGTERMARTSTMGPS